MTNKPPKPCLRGYFLGTLTPAAQERLEAVFFHDADCLARVLETESELIEDYVTDALRPAQRHRFEHHYLTTPAKIWRVWTVGALFRRAAALRQS